MLCVLIDVRSDWRSLSVFESELVHDIIDDEEETYEDEDDSNGTVYRMRRVILYYYAVQWNLIRTPMGQKKCPL